MSALAGSAVPRLLPGMRLRRDLVRDQWVLLAPERVIELDDIAYEVVSRIDGVRSVDALVDILAAEFDADRAQVAADVLDLLDDLVAKRVLGA
ncbi:pyrroloquinoline quinone biosynthesis peptide chaperone PqqD [Frateuria defendens]|uniref:pyrroloquinoline quinone biosynthesis peptide chaperone PqqD n=1 Tax=Frateuria defendens TaxID=2219559 RepID=UPI00066FB7DF